jgi:hypothetical protein
VENLARLHELEKEKNRPWRIWRLGKMGRSVLRPYMSVAALAVSRYPNFWLSD